MIGLAQSAVNLRCKIIDSSTKAPVSFASIQLKGKMIGVISNADGDFQLPYRYKSDTAIISCIGYTTRFVVINHLSDQVVNVLPLAPAARQLSQVVVSGKASKSYSPSRIVEMAIERIPENFPSRPYSYIGYYRDYQIKKDSNQYVNLNEALVEVFDKGFQTSDQSDTQISLYQYQENKDFQRDTLTQTPYDNKLTEEKRSKFIPNAYVFPSGGNELNILRLHDAIRNYQIQSFSFVDQLNKDFVRNHFFKREEVVFLDDVVLYVLSFRSVNSVTGPGYSAEGKIYIEKGNYAIHKIEYACYTMTGKRRSLLFDLQLEYARRNERMYLNYISFNNLFSVSDGQEFKLKEQLLDKDFNTLTLQFNREVNMSSALKHANFDIRINNEKLEIDEITGDRNDIVITFSKNERFKLKKKAEILNQQLKVEIRNVTDWNNRALDEVYLIPVQQYRELFVQKTNSSGSIRFQLRFKRMFPDQNEPQPFTTGEDYWMNTPLKGLK